MKKKIWLDLREHRDLHAVLRELQAPVSIEEEKDLMNQIEPVEGQSLRLISKFSLMWVRNLLTLMQQIVQTEIER